MEITVQKKKLANSQSLYLWANQQLLAKGYTNQVARDAALKAARHFRGRKLRFIHWVNRQPSQDKASAGLESRGTANKQAEFIRRIMVPKMEGILCRKGYNRTASAQLTQRLIEHAGGPQKCSLGAVWEAAKQWPTATKFLDR